MADEDQDKPAKKTKPHRPRWRKKRWWIFFIFIAFLVWLDGPGWRWAATKAADHFLPDLGFEGGFELSGRLTGGEIGINNLAFDSNTVVTVVGLDQFRLTYQLGKIIKGEIDSIELSNLHAQIDLAALPEKEEEDPEKEKSDIAALLANIRQRLVPMNIEIRELSTTIVRGEDPIFAIEPTNLLHTPGSDSFVLELGAMEFPGDRRVPAQSTSLEWLPESLQLATLDVMPGVGIRDLIARIRTSEDMDFATGILLDGVRFDAESDLKTARLTKEEKPLKIHETAKLFEVEIPAEATLNGLTLEARKLDGGLETLEADLQLSLSGINYDDWTSSRIALAAKLENDQTRVVIEGEALDSPLTIEIEAILDRAAGMLPTEAKVDFKIPKLEAPLALVRDRFKPIKPAEAAETAEATEPKDGTAASEPKKLTPTAPPPIPAASLAGSATANFIDGAPDQATAQLAIVSSEDAPPIDIKGSWSPSEGASGTLAIPSIRVEGAFDPEKQSYQATASLDQFSPESLSAWLDPFQISVPPGMTTSFNWEGSGLIEENTHQGKLELTSFEWLQNADSQPIKAFASASYDWPEKVSLAPLNIQQAANKIEGDVSLENQTLTLTKLAWSDGDEALFNGTAKIPVPEDPTDWRALLRDENPIEVNLESIELPLTKLHAFLPETTRFPADSRAKLDIKVSGTPADPVVSAKFKASRVGITSQPNIPPISIDLEAVGKEQTLKLEGEIKTPEYPPAVISAVSNWDPDKWAEDPETVKAAKLDVSAKIADFNLALLTRFAPTARKLSGNLNLVASLSGTVGEPKPSATITLDNGRFEMHDPSIPRVAQGSLKVVATPERVNLENLSGSISGGTLAVSGSVDLKDNAPSAINIRIKGDSLPAKRDASMLVRVNTDLTLAGPWETASLGGTIGIVDSIFFKDIEILPIGVPFNQPSEPSLPSVDAPPPAELTASVPEPFRNWGLNLKLKTRNPFLIRGNLATGEVYVDASINGTVSEPRPSGGATLREISAKLPFSTLKIKQGKVEFNPNRPFDPTLDIRGESVVRPYEINVYIYGPISNPKVLPTSNPPLPETEIMTLVATGATTSSMENPNAAAARGLQLLIEELRRGRIANTRSLRPLLAVLDRVDFQIGEEDPYTSTKYNSATFNIDDNWQIRAGISEDNNTRATLIYLFRFR